MPALLPPTPLQQRATLSERLWLALTAAFFAAATELVWPSMASCSLTVFDDAEVLEEQVADGDFVVGRQCGPDTALLLTSASHANAADEDADQAVELDAQRTGQNIAVCNKYGFVVCLTTDGMFANHRRCCERCLAEIASRLACAGIAMHRRPMCRSHTGNHR